MKLLCIDTSSDICSVCLMEDNIVLKLEELKNGKTHSENLMPLIQKVIENTKLEEIDKIACCVGPGSFTGIRIGISAIKAISEVKNIPIVSVTSLESLAHNEEFEGVTCTLIDARNNQAYCGIFKNNKLINDYIADDINFVLDTIKTNENILFVGNGATLHKEKILEKFNKQANFTEKNEQTSISIGKCALKKEKIDNADTLLPVYLRKSQAERMAILKDN